MIKAALAGECLIVLTCCSSLNSSEEDNQIVIKLNNRKFVLELNLKEEARFTIGSVLKHRYICVHEIGKRKVLIRPANEMYFCGNISVKSKPWMQAALHTNKPFTISVPGSKFVPGLILPLGGFEFNFRQYLTKEDETTLIKFIPQWR